MLRSSKIIVALVVSTEVAVGLITRAFLRCTSGGWLRRTIRRLGCGASSGDSLLVSLGAGEICSFYISVILIRGFCIPYGLGDAGRVLGVGTGGGRPRFYDFRPFSFRRVRIVGRLPFARFAGFSISLDAE